MAVELVDRLALMVVVCQFHGMGGVFPSRSLRSDNYDRMNKAFSAALRFLPFR
jgi:hypothetical protein